MIKKIIGIYQITCMANGKRYIGQSIDIKRRFNQHRRKLPYQMREDFERFGIDAFKFEILEECSVEELDKKETAYMNDCNPNTTLRRKGAAFPRRLAKSSANFTPVKNAPL